MLTSNRLAPRLWTCFVLAVVLVLAGSLASTAVAQEPFLGEIRWVPYNFAPRGWAFCDGQLLSISENTALFALIGTTFGGDGRTTFALPDLRGRVALHAGSGPGLTPRQLGQVGGQEQVTLTPGQMPAHSHPLNASSGAASEGSPAGNVLAATGDGGGGIVHACVSNGSGNVRIVDGPGSCRNNETPVSWGQGGGAGPSYSSAAPDVQMAPDAVGDAGGNVPHPNMQPFTGLHCIIALQGIFPSRN